MKKRISLLLILLITISSLLGCSLKTSKTETKQALIREPEWIKNSVIYEVNVRQYTKEGTFKAFKEHLPRLKEMGATVLWFMPIYPISEKERKGTLGSYYSIKDYKAINPEFGSFEEFKDLVDECHKMGFKVILDWVANHTGWDHVWMKNKNWYAQDSNGNIIIPPGTDWTDVAELNYDNQDMRKAMIDAMAFWVKEANIDGFRCDVAGQVPLDFWETARQEVEKIKPIYMLAEDEGNRDYLNKAFNSNYNWRLLSLMDKIASGQADAFGIRRFAENFDKLYPNSSYPMNFTTNHDENSWNGTEYERLKDAVDVMSVLTFTLPGIPLIYSGQEAALNKRLEFFEKDEINWNGYPKQNFYKDLIRLKKENQALWNGEHGGNIKFFDIKNDNVLAFVREKNGNRVIVIM
ncbi:MAG: alpha-amylase family glycosyl hydrolase, partial [Clostridiales bacterium]|nr:alpha-amylase family glycosyl hydrolase [Clostridiales bacterium]